MVALVPHAHCRIFRDFMAVETGYVVFCVMAVSPVGHHCRLIALVAVDTSLLEIGEFVGLGEDQRLDQKRPRECLQEDSQHHLRLPVWLFRQV